MKSSRRRISARPLTVSSTKMARHSLNRTVSLGFRRPAIHARCATRVLVPSCTGCSCFFTACSAGRPHLPTPRGLLWLSHGLRASLPKPRLASAALHTPQTARHAAVSQHHGSVLRSGLTLPPGLSFSLWQLFDPPTLPQLSWGSDI